MFNVNNSILEHGFINEAISKEIDIIEAIKKLKKEKNAIILAHYYQTADIQDIADFVGDSLKLAQEAEKTTADIILFAGVNFMAETAKILNPTKKVLLPDTLATCSLAESAPYVDFKAFVDANPNHVVVSYVNSSTEVKAITDIICTSSNAVQIVNSISKDKQVIFGPDKNLGNYIQNQTGRELKIWQGACHVHKQFDLERIIELKNLYPESKIVAHPECEKPVLIVSDFIGSTAAMLKFTQTDASKTFIVATESGILHQMQKAEPTKTFIAAPSTDRTCACNDCEYMKRITLTKIYLTLKYELPEIHIDESLRLKALQPIVKMLEISKLHGL